MKRIVMKHHEFSYQTDVLRIVKVLYENGYQCSEIDAQELWSMYSDSMAAGWMMLPDTDEELFLCIGSYALENSENENGLIGGYGVVN